MFCLACSESRFSNETDSGEPKEPQWNKATELRSQQKLIRQAQKLSETLQLKFEEMRHRQVKQHLSRGIEMLRSLTHGKV